MINFVLCDDNEQLLSKLRDLLESIFIKYNLNANILATISIADNLLNFINNNKVDVLFLDIDLNSKYNGIEIAKQIRKNNKLLYLVFLTGHFEYIISAYECKTFDYIQKPVTRAQLEKTVLRLFDDIHNNGSVFIRVDSKHEVVNQSIINYIQKDGVRAIYNMKSGNMKSYTSFNNIKNSLPDNFIRCHKSYIVNINNIGDIDLKTNTIYFKDTGNSRCFIGPKYKNNFMEVLNNYGYIK